MAESGLRKIEQDILANGKVDGRELEVLRRQLYQHGKMGRPEADFLVELHRQVRHRTPAFDQFFFQAIKEHILADGWIDAGQVAWLRGLLYADSKISDLRRSFLLELKGEAKHVCREFEALFEASLAEPPE
jgi:hypothetical protein